MIVACGKSYLEVKLTTIISLFVPAGCCLDFSEKVTPFIYPFLEQLSFSVIASLPLSFKCTLDLFNFLVQRPPQALIHAYRFRATYPLR